MTMFRALEAESRGVQGFLIAILTVCFYWCLRWLDVEIATRVGGAHADRVGLVFEMLTVGPILAFIPGFALQWLVRSMRARIAVAVAWAVVVVVCFQVNDWWGVRLGRV